MRFEFATATKIIFGAGTITEVATNTQAIGARALVVTGKNPDRALPLVDALEKIFVDCVTYPTSGEPTIQMVANGAKRARSASCDFVIGFGGGAALDAAKAIAALATNQGDPLNYLEVIGKGMPLKNAPLPFVAIPTTAGTGSEVTRNAVLASPEHRQKVSLRSPLMLAKLAVIDPELMLSIPPNVTAFTGMDAIAQVLEPYVSNGANPVTDAFCREGLPRGARSLLRAYQDNAADAREDMALTSLYGGLALANARLGAAHGFAGALGGMYDAPHGALVAALLPHVMAVNIRALSKRAPDSVPLRRYGVVATLLTGSAKAKADSGVKWVAELVKALKIPSLAAYGVEREHFTEIVEKAMNASSMRGNPIPLSNEELIEILERAL